MELSEQLFSLSYLLSDMCSTLQLTCSERMSIPNRLQYVEFFGKFYEGGGRAFNPFKLDTKYVDIKEEEG